VTALVRGQVVRADVKLNEPKLFLVVSNNRRNRNFPQVICARLTTTAKDPRPSVVELGHAEGFHGRVMCDDLEPIWEDEVIQVMGALTPGAMRAVDDGLLAALGITR
jgi:mRNA interferase MazF